MSLRTLCVAALGAAVLSVPQTTSAQGLRFGATAGPSFPVSDLGDATNVGFELSLFMDVKPVVLPMSLRFEGAWNQFGIDSQNSNVDGNVRSLSLTANGVVDFPTPSLVKFYAIGGLGLYNLDGSVSSGNVTVSGDSENKFGLNIGAGLRLPLTGLDAFVEARYHHTFDSNGVHFVPLVIGVRF